MLMEPRLRDTPRLNHRQTVSDNLSTRRDGRLSWHRWLVTYWDG